MTTNTNAVLLLAERYLFQGALDKALTILEKHAIQVKPLQAFIACGDVCKAQGSMQDALDAYTQANALWQLVDLGDACLAKNDVALAFFAYNAAKCGPKIALVATIAMKQKNLDIAYQCYETIADRGGLLSVGKVAEDSQNIELAIRAFTRAEAVDRLVALGMHALKVFEESCDTTNYISYAEQAFRASKKVEHLKLCGDAYLMLLRKQPAYGTTALEWAIKDYTQAGVPLPVTQLLAIVDDWLRQSSDTLVQQAEDACRILCEAGILPTCASPFL